MRALILAAGVGRRLSGFDLPKIMLSFGGRTLLERHLSALDAVGVTDVTIGVGFKAEAVRRALDSLGRDDVATVHNPDFERGSVVTLWTLRDAMTRGGDVLLMDGDVLYDSRLLSALLANRRAACMLADRAYEPGDEPVKIGMANGELVDFGKKLDAAAEPLGESVGFFRFDPRVAARLIDEAGAMIESGRDDELFEEALRTVVRAAPPGTFGIEDITGLPWTEIDFPEDVARARDEILPRLEGGSPS